MDNPQSGQPSLEIDGILIERISRRDENALSLLYDRYAVLAHSILMRMLRSVEDADDILQDIFTQLWNNPDQHEVHSGSLLITLITITHNRGLTRIRTRGVKKQNVQLENHILPLYSDSASLNDLPGLITPATPSQVLDALRKLSGDEQRMLSLAYYEGYSLTEISSRLNLPPGTVSWALWKSLSDLQELLNNEKRIPPQHEKIFLESCAAYVLDVLDAHETIEFKKHIEKGCEICRGEITRLNESAAMIPLGLPHMALAPELKQRILFATRLSEVMKGGDKATDERKEEIPVPVQKQKGTEKPAHMRPMAILVILILFIALMASIIYSVSLQRKLSQQLRPVDQQQLVERLSETVEHKNDLFEILASKDLTIIPFESYQSNLQSEGKMFWDTRDTSAVLQIAHLPTIPDDQQYQLWAFANGSYYLCGTFTVKRQLDPENFFLVRIPHQVRDSRTINFFVTLEKTGNANTPRGKRYISVSITTND